MMMKLNLGIIILMSLWLTACSDFLEESSQDEVRPSLVTDIEQLLIGEAYWGSQECLYNITDIFTDDMGTIPPRNQVTEPIVSQKYYQYSWCTDMFAKSGGGFDDNFWALHYKKIAGCNVVLDYLDKVSGDEDLREHIRGEALVLRAYYYLQLVNLFGLPYNYGDPKENLGVPLKLSMDITAELFVRESVAKVYELIERDLLEGNRLLEESTKEYNFNRINHLAAKALLSRVYLYMERWDDALRYAEEVLKVQSDLLSFSSFSDISSQMMYHNSGVYAITTPEEIIFGRPYYTPSVNYYGETTFVPSDELLGLYEYYPKDPVCMGDLRGKFSFSRQYGNAGLYESGFFKGSMQSTSMNGCGGIRVAEMYLNRAEVNIHKFMDTGDDEYRVKALNDLNLLREHRWDTRKVAYSPKEVTDAEELFEFYKSERRRELCGEDNHRWFDLRRLGMPELKHVYLRTQSEKEEFSLSQGSSLYVLPIPEEIIRVNPKLKQNP